MKLRQKLAAALATAMVVTSVPVVTMAASSNKVVKAAQVIEKDEVSTSAALRIKFEDGDASAEEFYFTLENAEWIDASEADQAKALEGIAAFKDYGTNKEVWKFEFASAKKEDGKPAPIVNVEYTRQDDTTLKVKVDKAVKDEQISFPLPIKATGGSVSVAVTGEGGTSTISEGKYAIATTGEDSATLAVDTDANTFYDNGELSKIILKETFVGSLAGKQTVLKVELNNTDFEFVNSTVQIKGTYGFNGTETTKLIIDADDKSTGYIVIPNTFAKAASLGRLEITGLKVNNDEKAIEAGDLLADIKTVTSEKVNSTTLTGTGELDKDYKSVVVAKIASYGAAVQMKDEKAVDVVAGREEEVTFEIKETVDDVFVGGRTITLELKDNEKATDESFFMITKEQKANPTKLIDEDDRKIVDKIEFVWEDEADFNGKDADSIYYKKGVYRANAIKVTLKGEDKDHKKLNANEEKDSFKVKTNIYVPVDQREKKTIDITASMRGVDEFKSTTAVNVVNPFDVTFDTTTLKVGLQKQEAGKITITEKAKEMFQKGDLYLSVVEGSKANTGIVIEEIGDLVVTGDLKKADIDDVKGNKQSVITLKRQSKSASALTIENMELTADRTVPEGKYDLELSGSAIDEYDGTYTVEDYIVIGTANTQDITASNGLAKGTATFAIGANKYTLNGEEKTMDAASYIQDPGYTMVPVRYVAQAFGVAESDIMFGKGTVTIFAGTRTVQLTNGSEIAVVNGAKVAMSTKVVIKNNRTYAPIGEIAKILGVSSSWDNTTKTATFTNK